MIKYQVILNTYMLITVMICGITIAVYTLKQLVDL